MKSVLVLILMAAFTAQADDLATEKVLSADYLLKMQNEPNAVVLADGIVVRSIFDSNSSDKPSSNDRIEVMYEGFDREGNVFDSSFLRDATATFPINGLIQCWQKALPTMSVGSVVKISCPSEQAYGDKGAGSMIKPGAAISFRVVLLKIK